MVVAGGTKFLEQKEDKIICNLRRHIFNLINDTKVQ